MKRTCLLSAALLAATISCDDLQVQGTGNQGDAIPIDKSDSSRLVVQGGTNMVFGAPATNWVILDPQTKKLQSVKWTLPVASVKNVPDSIQQDVRFWVDVPKEFAEQLVFNELSYDYLPHGHEPKGVFNVKHWEFHLVAITREEAEAIDCADTSLPPDRLLPKAPGWFVIGPPDNCTPSMGLHAITPLTPEFSGQEKFTKGGYPAYYKKKFASYEAKASTEYLLKNVPSFTIDVPRVPAPRPGLYPGSLTVTYDNPSETYIFHLSDFSEAEVIPE